MSDSADSKIILSMRIFCCLLSVRYIALNIEYCVLRLLSCGFATAYVASVITFVISTQGVFGNAIPVGADVCLLQQVNTGLRYRYAKLRIGAAALLFPICLYLLVGCDRMERISSSGLYYVCIYTYIYTFFCHALVRLGSLLFAAAAVGVTLIVGGFYPTCIERYLSRKDSVYSGTLV